MTVNEKILRNHGVMRTYAEGIFEDAYKVVDGKLYLCTDYFYTHEGEYEAFEDYRWLCIDNWTERQVLLWLQYDDVEIACYLY